MEDPFKGLKDLLPILVFLLPGFVSSGLVGMLVVRRPRETFDKCLEALILTAANVALFALLRALLESLPKLHIHFDRTTWLTPGNVALMAFCAILIGVAIGYEATNERCFQHLRDWKITRKTTKISTWIETFGAVQKYVIVHLKDERRIYGWPRFYSDDPRDRAIFLENASWIREDNTLHNAERISIFLDKESGIELIEFLDFSYEQTDPTGEASSSDRPERAGTEGGAEAPASPPAAPAQPGERALNE